MDDVDQMAWKGHIYRTLYGARVEGDTPTSCEETTYLQMPENYTIAPDEVSIVAHVIAAHRWDVYRVCLRTGCYGTKQSEASGEAGELLNSGQFWETDEGKYRVKEACAGESYHRLLLRQPCQAHGLAALHLPWDSVSVIQCLIALAKTMMRLLVGGLSGRLQEVWVCRWYWHHCIC